MGGALVSEVKGMARPAAVHGGREIEHGFQAGGRISRPGTGPLRLKRAQLDVKTALEELLDPLTRGDPTSPLRWTCQSSAKLAAALQKQGWSVSAMTVGRLLHQLGYNAQSVLESPKDGSCPHGNGQFEYINAKAAGFLDSQQPVISVQTTTGNRVGHRDNVGRQRKGSPEEVFARDVAPRASNRSRSRGWPDKARDEARSDVDSDSDTPACAVASVRRWWRMMGKPAYPHAKRLFITADASGSNGYRSSAWKLELQRLADDIGLRIHVSHFPPGLSKWNTIGHHLFCHVTQNRRGKRLRSVETVVELSSQARVAVGLPVKAPVDGPQHSTRVAVSKTRLTQLDLHPSKFRGEWNYELRPRNLAR